MGLAATVDGRGAGRGGLHRPDAPHRPADAAPARPRADSVPPIAGFVSFDAQALFALHYDIDINDVLPQVLGVKE